MYDELGLHNFLDTLFYCNVHGSFITIRFTIIKFKRKPLVSRIICVWNICYDTCLLIYLA